MDKTVNQKAWFLVLPVFLVVAFSAVLPLMIASRPLTSAGTMFMPGEPMK